MKKIIARGVDVSNPGQGKIANWELVSQNVDFAILKIGNAYESEPYYVDAQFERNSKACMDYNIPYGVYVYQYFTTLEKAKEGAKETIKCLNGRKLAYPVFLDIEELKLFKLGKAKLLELTKAFCSIIEDAGYEFGVYCSTSFFEKYLVDKWYDSKIKWLAQYNKEVTYKGEYDIWQYSSQGTIPGISGFVDVNYCYLSFEKGDVNGDGEVTAADARIILRAAAGLEQLDEHYMRNADINADGKVTAADAREALRKSIGVEAEKKEIIAKPTVVTYSLKKDAELFLSPHFQVKEFACKDGSDKILINTGLIRILEKLFDKLNCKAINITSGYRTPSHSVKVGGYSTDQHTKGNAADITCKKKDGTLFSSTEICCALEDLNHQGGIGRINTRNSVHVDVRGSKCWFDEVNGEKTTNSWYAYLEVKR